MASKPDFRTLLGVQTFDERLAAFANSLVTLGTTFTNWNPGGKLRTFAEVVLDGIQGVAERGLTIAEMGIPIYATGDVLDAHLRSVGSSLFAATRAKGNLTVSVSQAVTVAKGRRCSTPPDAQGRVFRFRVTAETIVNAPSGLVPIEADEAGAAWNVAAGSITVLDTAIANVTGITNADDWLTTAGTNRESDADGQERYTLFWPALAGGPVAETYESWAQSADAGVMTVHVRDQFPRGPGTVDIVITGPVGIPSDELVATVQTAIDAAKPHTDDAKVVKPTGVAINGVIQIWVSKDTAADLDDVRDEATKRWAAQFVPDADLDPRLWTDQDGIDDADRPVPVKAMAAGQDWIESGAGHVLFGSSLAEIRRVKVWDAVAGVGTLASDVTIDGDELATNGLTYAIEVIRLDED